MAVRISRGEEGDWTKILGTKILRKKIKIKKMVLERISSCRKLYAPPVTLLIEGTV